ncbi:MAG: hypothetical protein GX592_10020 [Clostridiales bacterium]|nr:hypothetical protein [Clostridiales bacterium]
MPIGKEYEAVRCVFCMTGHEQQVADSINEGRAAKAIFPVQIKRIRNRRTWQEVPVSLLPSYVFVYSDAELRSADLAKVQNVIRVLRYGDDSEGVLCGSDRTFADLLWARGGKLGVLKAMRVGERVEIVDGLFKALRGRVVAMDKRKQVAKVELDIVGSLRNIWLSFDYLKEGQGE